MSASPTVSVGSRACASTVRNSGMAVWNASSSVWLSSKTVSDVLCTTLFRKNQQQHGNELPCLSIDGLTIGKLLGQGGFGKVFSVAKTTDKLEIMACKKFDMHGVVEGNGVKLQAEVASALAEIQNDVLVRASDTQRACAMHE
ncbi:hypothetical protein KP509_28G058900 [Ceratopteris richardii]|uniref:Protein kinase domain-containing protein n=1 Tax=Ceratopteris richardii TaxID=49495 RepID=A0A8T2REI2_CERRI|nr:hypothetical protein KP509_28G058900 [Ceratopteris richardii]